MVAILGINCFSHDTAACLLVDGDVVALGEQERFNRDHHTKAFPHDAVELCLRAGSLDAADLSEVVFAHQPALDFARGATDAVLRAAPRRLAAQAFTDANLVRKELAFRRRWGYRGPIRHVGHHEAHAAGAFFSGPFDEAAVLTMDRGGDFLSTTLYAGRGNRLRPLDKVRNPHSMGEVYSAVTAHLGFHAGADEGKVMGLAPYGTDRLAADLARLMRLSPGELFRVDLSWFRYHREHGWVSPRFTERFGPPRVPESVIEPGHQDLAHAVQALAEQVGLHVARQLRVRSGSANLCLSGGVALNSVMNTRLLREAGFEQIFIQPAASDAGNALGAALWAWHMVRNNDRGWRMRHAFLGDVHDETACRRALEQARLPYRRVEEPALDAAALLDAGRVVGWFQGRAEVGPRALGARSILADPRRAEMKDVVNARVKRREGFRPFAPSVLDERARDWFVDYYPNPFMLLVEDVRPEQRTRIPAVTHVDGSARLQTVRQDENPAFHRVIAQFERRTGVPVVLNTSFNLRGEPIVSRPEEAVHDYLVSGMDALLLGPYLCEKQEGRPEGRPSTGGAG